MTPLRYWLFFALVISTAVPAWLFFTDYFESNAEQQPQEVQIAEFQLAANELYNQVPRDNDSSYSLPTFIPSRPSQGKVQFQGNMDNDALYSTPAELPVVSKAAEQAPAAPQFAQPTPTYVAPAPAPSAQAVAPVQPAAPLRPQPRQPEEPVYVPQYQQPQYQEPQYQSREYQSEEVQEEAFPNYYYY